MPRESNMAEPLRLMKTMIVKVDDLATDMKDVKSDVKELKTRMVRVEAKVDGLEVKVDRLEGKVDSIAQTVMKNDRRLTAVEHQIETGI